MWQKERIKVGLERVGVEVEVCRRMCRGDVIIHRNTWKCAVRGGPARITEPCEFHRLRQPFPQLLPNYSLLLENSSTSGTTNQHIYCPIHGNCLWKPLFFFGKFWRQVNLPNFMVWRLFHRFSLSKSNLFIELV